MNTPPMHGGPDSGPPIRFDFSTNANPYGPPAALWSAVRNADRQRYPDPSYSRLREQLASWHEVQARQIEPASGGAEAIRRLTLAAHLDGVNEVWVPQPGFGDYASAAAALGLRVSAYDNPQQIRPSAPALIWVCDPCNPTGASFDAHDWQAVLQVIEASGSVLAVDQAYEALRLDGHSQMPPALSERAWRLQCPNKALGLTGVRAAYLIAPSRAERPAVVRAVSQLAASWVLSAEGVALLMHWHDADTLDHLEGSRQRLRLDRTSLHEGLRALGWQQRNSLTPFWLARPPERVDGPHLLIQLREQGIKLRDATSFGLPGWVRVAAQPAESVAMLRQTLKRIHP